MTVTDFLADKFLKRLIPTTIVIVSLLGVRPKGHKKESKNQDTAMAGAGLERRTPGALTGRCGAGNRDFDCKTPPQSNSFVMLELRNP
jgi:hypothetical protein